MFIQTPAIVVKHIHSLISEYRIAFMIAKMSMTNVKNLMQNVINVNCYKLFYTTHT